MRAADPVALGAWYRDCLGLDADENGLWRQEAGLTVFATFESETDYFGSRAQQTMLNFRVRDLDAMLAQLRAKGADVAKRRRTWRVSVDSAGSPIPRAIGSSCGSPPDRVFERAFPGRNGADPGHARDTSAAMSASPTVANYAAEPNQEEAPTGIEPVLRHTALGQCSRDGLHATVCRHRFLSVRSICLASWSTGPRWA